MRVSELPIYRLFGDWKHHTNISLQETRIVGGDSVPLFKTYTEVITQRTKKISIGTNLQNPHLQVLIELSTDLMRKRD